MSDICFAYKSNKGCIESYRDHILEIIQCMRERWEFRGLKKKLNLLLGVPEKLVDCYLTLAVLLHDIGKTSKVVQEKCKQKECKEFPGHYITSSFLTLRLSYDLFRDTNIADYLIKILTSNDYMSSGTYYTSKDEVEKYLFITLTFLPVLLHHYPSVTEKSIDSYLKNVPPTIELSQPCRQVILDIIKDIEYHCSSEGLRVILTKLKTLLEGDSPINLGILPLRYNLLYSTIPSFSKGLVEAATGLLNLCDGRTASKNRQC
ncbi:MAG: hypothetical protein QXO93_06015 [Acidilobaceae archaeon]